MKEVRWVKEIVAPAIEEGLKRSEYNLSVRAGHKLPYAYEIKSYKGTSPHHTESMEYQTDLLIVENFEHDEWIPRVVVEAKKNGQVTTHDAITYSHKAMSHRQVHPYLRYGILLGENKHYGLPGRLVRHGTQFDFMISWAKEEPTDYELNNFIEMLLKEVEASKKLEEIIYKSRKKSRGIYTMLHKELKAVPEEKEN